MKEVFFKIYFVLVSVLLFSILFTILYEEVLCEYVYTRHLPNPVIVPQYSIETGLVTNTDEVTFWSEWDHIPWYGILSRYIAGYTTVCGCFTHLLLLTLLIPVGIFNIKKTLWLYWLILLGEHVGCWILIGNVIAYYW